MTPAPLTATARGGRTAAARAALTSPVPATGIRARRSCCRDHHPAAGVPSVAGTAGSADPTVLWRLRAAVRNPAGGPARLCAALAGLGVDVLTLSTRPAPDGSVDDFLLRAPADAEPRALAAAVRRAGGSGVLLERAESPASGASGGACASAGDTTAAPAGITVRPAGPDDRAAALALHDRCSLDTLYQRYHGPVSDAGRYLNHLLSPRHGHTLAAQTGSGRLVGLGHLLWDGEETEVALLVEDEWQRRGIGGLLLRELIGLARESDREAVYAVTRPANTAMAAAMRALRLPLDHQTQDGTTVITAILRPPDTEAAAVPAPAAHRAAACGR
jgi:GNAT superfamily N-acetyltransferase